MNLRTATTAFLVFLFNSSVEFISDVIKDRKINFECSAGKRKANTLENISVLKDSIYIRL